MSEFKYIKKENKVRVSFGNGRMGFDLDSRFLPKEVKVETKKKTKKSKKKS